MRGAAASPARSQEGVSCPRIAVLVVVVVVLLLFAAALLLLSLAVEVLLVALALLCADAVSAVDVVCSARRLLVVRVPGVRCVLGAATAAVRGGSAGAAGADPCC